MLAAIASWKLAFVPPRPSLDPSWSAALAIAARRGMDFGSDVVFTFGPLGFLREPWRWYDDLAVLGFVYSAALYIALSISLVWALRRTVNGAAALILAFVVLVAATSIEVAVALTAVWCLAALSATPPPFALRLVSLGGAVLGTIELLVLLRSGTVILAMCAVTLLAHHDRRRELPIFAVGATLCFTLLWFAARQGIGNLPDFAGNAAQIVSGYSEAMGTPAASSGPNLIGVVLLGATLVAGAALCSAPGGRRVAAGAVMALAAFVVFKEGIVRPDPGHQAIFFTTAVGLGAGLPFGPRRVLAIAAVLGLVAVASVFPRKGHVRPSFNPVTHAREAADQARLLVSPGRRERVGRFGRFGMLLTYRLPPSTQRLLRGRSVHVDPWEAGVVWAYGLRWGPLPVFQDYTAYTATLDRLNAHALRSPDGPQRILRENTRLVDPKYPTPAIDLRYPAWDPPEQSLAMLCNYVPLQTTARWQVLGKVPDRCEPPRLIGSAKTRYGVTVSIPPAPAGQLVFARIRGAGVSGFERLRSFLYRARFRYVLVNGTSRYRLVPGTAGDGLIMRSSPRTDYPAPFTLSPDARTVQLTGLSGDLRIDLYSMRVRAPG